VRVLFVDDHEVIWAGMMSVVERLHAQVRPGGQLEWHCARDLREALATDAEALDLILLDFHLPGGDCMEAMRSLRQRFDAAPIVIVSGDERPDLIRRCIEAGAAGYVPKSMVPAEMVAALGLVMAHGIYLPPSALLAAGTARDRDRDRDVDDALGNDALAAFMAAELSPRQREVFARALRGKPNKVIARELGIAEGTVKVHLAMVFRALGVHNRTEAMYRVLSADAVAAVARL